MKPSFRQFMSDHDRIEEAAASLLSDVDNQATPADQLYDALNRLATVVEDHIADEDRVVSSLDAKIMAGPWQATWAEGKSSFERLRSDWIAFLGRWSVERIIDNRRLFSFECKAILGRISERLRQETQSFYAAALQFDTISLR